MNNAKIVEKLLKAHKLVIVFFAVSYIAIAACLLLVNIYAFLK